MTTQMDSMINKGMGIPKLVTTGKTILCQKHTAKGNAVDNYQPIPCLLLLWKLMNVRIANSLYE